MLETAVYSLLAALRSFRIGVVMSSEDCLEAFCDCLCDAGELRKLNSVFEGSTRVSASFCRVLHCLAVLQNGIHSSVQCSACLRDQKRPRFGSSEKETAAQALLFTETSKLQLAAQCDQERQLPQGIEISLLSLHKDRKLTTCKSCKTGKLQKSCLENEKAQHVLKKKQAVEACMRS